MSIFHPDVKTQLHPKAVQNLIQGGLDSSDFHDRAGLHCDKLLEGYPAFIEAPCEKRIEGENNTWIVLGRDRPSHLESGTGGRGDTGCGMVYIGCGRGGPHAHMGYENGEALACDHVLRHHEGQKAKDNIEDAAGIYITQTALDLDKYYGLRSSTGAPSLPYRSGIGIKADCVRIVGREGIRFVTECSPVNSKGVKIDSVHGIDLIAGGLVDQAEPFVKGHALIECLKEMNKKIIELSDIFKQFVDEQGKFNAKVASHGHVNTIGQPVLPNPSLILAGTVYAVKSFSNTIMSGMNSTLNTSNIDMKYLSPSGEKYINSRYNYTN